jgi:SAM-dependent methyltransferase
LKPPAVVRRFFLYREARMPAMYEKFSPFYDLEYGAKDDDLPFYLEWAGRCDGPVLEIGAGTGRVTLELAQAGHAVWGIDDSARMLRQARRKVRQLPARLQPRVHLVRADMRRFDLKRTFGLCIIPFRAFLHNLTQNDQLATLRCIAAHLRPGGVLTLDLFVPLHRVLGQSRWRLQVPPEDLPPSANLSGIEVAISHNPSRQLLTITNHYRPTRGRQVSASMKYRYIHRTEMELLLLASGFKLRACLGGFSGQPYDFHSGIMCFIAEKKENKK